jgi:predicted acylesterase/phospholipase RssA
MERTIMSTQPVALVLSGGSIRGVAHIGMLQALNERKLLDDIDLVVGTSAGAIIGSMFALGYTPEDIWTLWNTDVWQHYGGHPDPSVVKDWAWGDVVSSLFRHDLTRFRGLIRGDMLQTELERYLQVRPPGTKLRPTGKPRELYLATTNFNTGRETLFRFTRHLGLREIQPALGRAALYTLHHDQDSAILPGGFPTLAQAVRASVSIPFVFVPVQLRVAYNDARGIDESLYVDGGVRDNYALGPAVKLGQRQRVFGMFLGQVDYPQHAPWAGMIDLAMRMIDLMGRTIFEADQDDAVIRKAAIRTLVPYFTSNISTFDVAQMDLIYRIGYGVTRGFLDEVAQLTPGQPLTWDAIFSAEGMQRMKPAGINPPDPRVPAAEKTNYYIYELPLTAEQLRALPLGSSTRAAVSSQPRDLSTSSWIDAAPAAPTPSVAKPIEPVSTSATPTPSVAKPIEPVSTSAAPVAPATPLTDGPENIHALLIGINTYLAPSVNNLNGCEHDTQAFAAFLRQRLRLRDDHMTMLLSTDADPHKQPTRDTIITAMIDLGERIKPDDRVIIFYAGHGSRTENPGKRSETIVPMDSRQENIYDIRDFELSVLLQGITSKTADLTVILDSCHSSGATRGREIVRMAEPDTRPQPAMDPRINRLQDTLKAMPAPARQLVPGADSVSASSTRKRSMLSTGEDGWGLNPENRYIVIAGCQAQETSAEQPLGANGEFRGLLSWHLLATLQSHQQGPNAHWEEIFLTVQQAVTTARPSQRPVIDGDQKRFVLGGAWTPRDPGFGVLQQDDQFSLEAGAVAGVTPGVLVGVYRSGLPEFPNDQATDQQQRLCTLEVTGASPLKAVAQLVTGTLPAQGAGPLRGRVVVPRPTDQLPVRLPTSELSSIVLQSPWLTASEKPIVDVQMNNNAYQLVRTADQRIIASIEQSAQAVAKVCLLLERYARYWSTMMRQYKKSERIPSNQALEVSLFNPNTDQEIQKNADGSYTVPLKSDFVIVIRNTKRWPLYAVCVNCTGSVQVEYLYPYSEEAPIAPQETRTVGEGWVSEKPSVSVMQLPKVRPFTAGLPEGVSQGTDRLRVFGTTRKPTDIRDLLELVPRLEKFAQALPEQLSSNYAPVAAGVESGSRNLEPPPEDQEDMWTVTDCVVHIKGS